MNNQLSCSHVCNRACLESPSVPDSLSRIFLFARVCSSTVAYRKLVTGGCSHTLLASFAPASSPPCAIVLRSRPPAPLDKCSGQVRVHLLKLSSGFRLGLHTVIQMTAANPGVLPVLSLHTRNLAAPLLGLLYVFYQCMFYPLTCF